MRNLKKMTVLAIVIMVLLTPAVYAASSRASASASASGGSSATADSSATASGGGSAEVNSVANAVNNGEAGATAGTNAGPGENKKVDCISEANGDVNIKVCGDTTTTLTVTGASTTTTTTTTSESGTTTSSEGNILSGIPVDIISYTLGSPVSSGFSTYSYSSSGSDKQITTANSDGVVIVVSGQSDVLVPIQEQFDNGILDDENIAIDIPEDVEQTQSGVMTWIFGLLNIA